LAEQELARDLGFLEAYTMGVGTMIGAGIFVLPSIAIANAGPASMISFAIGGVVSLLAALSLSELATGMPRAGGSYYYVNRALGGFWGSMVGWGMWSGLMFATAFYMLGFGQYLTYFSDQLPVVVSALIMAALLLLVNYRGVKETGSLQNIIVLLLIGSILVFIAFGIFEVDWQTFKPFNPQGWGAVAATAATIYVSFIGFEVIATSAEEVKNPGRNLPLAMIASVLTPTLLYMVVILISSGVLPMEQIIGSRIPVADVAQQYLGGFGALLMVGGAIMATVSSANASILSAARVNFAMGRDGLLSDWLNTVHHEFRTPYRAILVTGGVILLLIGVGVGIETLANVASFAYLATYALVHVAVMVMRQANPPHYEPDFQLPAVLYPVVPVAGIIATLIILSRMQPLVLGLGLGILTIGIFWYLVYARKHYQIPSMIGDAIVANGREQETPARYRVVVAVANPRTEQQLLDVAGRLAAAHAPAEVIAVNVVEVPYQTALEQEMEFEEQRVRNQRELLDSAREMARSLQVGLRTRAVIGRHAGQALLNILREEQARHLVMGWGGRRKRTGAILGKNIDTLASEASCGVTVVKFGGERDHQVLALVGEGPNAPQAVRQAAAMAKGDPATSLTLLNVQPETATTETDPERRGNELIHTVSDHIGLSEEEFTPQVVISSDIEETLLSETLQFDTICVGATRSTAMTQFLFGSIPERLGERHPGTVLIAREPEYQPRTILQAITERLRARSTSMET